MALSVSLICENSRRRARNTKKAVCESSSEPPNADAVFERSFDHKPVVDFRRGLCTVSGAFTGVLVQIMGCIALYAVRRDRDCLRTIYARKVDTIWELILQHLSPPAKPVLLSHPLLLHPCILHRPPPFFTQDFLMQLHIFRGTETGTAEIVLAALPDHPNAEKGIISRSDFAQQTLLQRELGSETRALTEANFQLHDFAPARTLEIGGRESVLLAVQNGLGIAPVSLEEVGTTDPVLILHCADFRTHGEIHIACLANRLHIPIVKSVFAIERNKTNDLR